MKVVIPYKKASAKSRLSPVLSREEREEFVELMLNQVIDTLIETGIRTIDILSPSMYGLENMTKASVLLDKNDLNEALNRYLEQAEDEGALRLVSPVAAAPKALRLGSVRLEEKYRAKRVDLRNLFGSG